ncbi:DUF1579 family protein [Lewinella sp. 4G2]|uniref:DUF1579 family protein n=1 Tax=Lewinella sp. 4G2 TaxID=1803372 RepID=UPI0007B49BCF|nr:DUF1579 family protein [Lewinella sp. 4G2]OAV46312.1 hypothetical protein A3850_017180 [Lewinella sp. 4G2]
MNNNRIENTEFKKLIGKWKTEGRILATENSPEMKITGTDTYELILNGYFVLHKADVMMGKERSKTFEIIGLDPQNDRITLEHYNNQGASGKMSGTLKNNELKIYGEMLRFKGKLNASDNQLIGTWEKKDDLGEWKSFLGMKLTK